MSFKVTDFGTNRKPICDFLLVINTNLHPILHHFEAIADYCSNLVQISLFVLSPLGSRGNVRCSS